MSTAIDFTQRAPRNLSREGDLCVECGYAVMAHDFGRPPGSSQLPIRHPECLRLRNYRRKWQLDVNKLYGRRG